MVWLILGVISVILLAVYFKSRNSVWGGLTLGVIISLIMVVFAYFQNNNFNWYIMGKTIIVCVLLGFGTELLGKIGDLMNKK